MGMPGIYVVGATNMSGQNIVARWHCSHWLNWTFIFFLQNFGLDYLELIQPNVIPEMNWRYSEGGRFPLCIRDLLFQVLCKSECYVYCLLYLGMTSVCGDISVRDVSHLLREIMGAVTAAPETGTLSSRDGQQAPCDVQISFKPWLHKSDCEYLDRTLSFIFFSIVIIYIYGQNVVKHWIKLFTAPLSAERNRIKLLSLKLFTNMKFILKENVCDQDIAQDINDISNNTM